MMPAESTTDRYFRRLRDNPGIAIVIVAAIGDGERHRRRVERSDRDAIPSPQALRSCDCSYCSQLEMP
jgi:hypothetical protein